MEGRSRRDVCRRAGAQYLFDRLCVLDPGKHDDRDARILLAEDREAVQSVEDRHVEVEDDEVWCSPGDEGSHLRARRGDADDFEVIRFGEVLTECLVDQRVIVDEDDTVSCHRKQAMARAELRAWPGYVIRHSAVAGPDSELTSSSLPVERALRSWWRPRRG